MNGCTRSMNFGGVSARTCRWEEQVKINKLRGNVIAVKSYYGRGRKEN